MTRVEERYLNQSIREFVEYGGNAREYAELVFSGAIFGPGNDVTDKELEIFTVDDLTAELEHLIALDARLQALEANREATQFQPAREGAVSRSHNVNMSEAAHAAFARLSPQERGDLIETALLARH